MKKKGLGKLIMFRHQNFEKRTKIEGVMALTIKIFQKPFHHTGIEALPSKKKVSIDGTGVPGFLRPVW